MKQLEDILPESIRNELDRLAKSQGYSSFDAAMQKQKEAISKAAQTEVVLECNECSTKTR